MNLSLIIMITVAAIIGVILVVIIILTRGRKGLLDQEKYRVRWLEIENGLDKNNTATYQFAVLAADKLLEQALHELGLAGETMIDRLKNAKNKLSNPNIVLTAHKLRDQIARKTDAKINTTSVRRALAIYKKSLKELGAI
ncbi:hypothetical protein FWH58_00165 [Candidatus Saccharibacteria bacterium]|nr:hypothetical protein [Candidatus Saccharibacteria bacterium]